MINIAVDGPAGAGKSTVCKQAAKELGYIYVDTGAMYRALAYYFFKNKVFDVDRVKEEIDNIKIEVKFINGEQRIFLCGEDVSDFIRTPEIASLASKISANKIIRNYLLNLQRNIAKSNNVLMDGRDIGTVILPNADVKIYLTASKEERARRRYKEFVSKGVVCNYEKVLEDIEKRDYNDSHREIAPLKPSFDSVIIDTSNLSFEESVKELVDIIKEKIKCK